MRRYGRLFLVATLLSCLFTSCRGQSLEKISALAGETVILPCHIALSGDLPTVEWSKEGLNPNITFLYRDGCETFEMKNPLFEHRTNLIMNKLKYGNISLIISNVQLTDAGKYQCVVVLNRNRNVIKTLELVVGAVSEPKLSVVPGVDDGMTLQCETNWFPEPEVTFLDDQGNSISAENPKRVQDSSGCFTITRRVTLQTATSRVTCRVHEPQMNKTRDTEIYIQAHCMKSCIIPIIIAVPVTIVLFAVGTYGYCFLRKKRVGKKICECSSQCTTCRIADVQQRNQADNNENATTELQRRTRELENQLQDKEEKIRQLTKELNDLRSRQSPVLQHSQPTISNSSSPSSSDLLKSFNLTSHHVLHDKNTKPPVSPNNNHPKSENLPKNKDSNPGVSTENPALGSSVQPSSHKQSSPSLPDNGALAFTSSSSSISKGKHLVRTWSESRPCPNVAKIPRRNTISAPCIPSYNRFSILENLTEESEMLLSGNQ